MPVDDLIQAFSEEFKEDLENNTPAAIISICIWILISSGFSLYFLVVNRTKKQLVALNNRLGEDIATLDVNRYKKDDFSFIFFSLKRANEKIKKQELEIESLTSAYKNTVGELSGLIENFINDINFVFNIVSKDERQSNVVLSEIFQNIIQLNQLQSSIIKVFNGIDEDDSLTETSAPDKVSNEIQLAKDSQKSKQHSQIYIYGFDESTLVYFRKFLRGIFQNEQVSIYKDGEKFIFQEDRKILFLINSALGKKDLQDLSKRFLENPEKFLISFIDSQISPLSRYAPKFLKPLINNRVLFLSNYLHIKDLFELSVINLRFKKLTEFTKNVYIENKIEQILIIVHETLIDLFPNLTVAFSRREKFILPDDEEIEAAEKARFNAVKELYYVQTESIVQFSHHQNFYYCAELQATQNILMVIECRENFGRLQKSIFDNIFHITNNRFQNFNPLLREPKYVNIIRKIIQDFEKIEYIKSSRQYSIIQYLDKNKTTKIERIPLYILADYLKGYFLQPNRSYLINPSKIKKIVNKDKKYSIPLSNEEASIYKNFLQDFKNLFPYWFYDIGD